MEAIKKSRYTIDIDVVARMQLAAIARQYQLAQGEVIEVLLSQAGAADGQPGPAHAALVAKRAAKVAQRPSKAALYAKFKALTPAQVAALAALAPRDA